MREDIILSRLLDKYEKSKHLLEPGASNRRVMLRTEKKDFPEYDYQDAEIRDAYNEAAKNLEQEGLVYIEWVKGRPVMVSIVLNMNHVMQCYQRIHRLHPRELAQEVEGLVTEFLQGITTEWIISWRDQICKEARELLKVPQFCKHDLTILTKLLIAFKEYDLLQGASITMRTFSSQCYHDTKYFEYEIRSIFLNVALKYYKELSETVESEGLGVRDQLAYLGIYARPELYELSGDCKLRSGVGEIDFSASYPYGLGIPSTFVDEIISVDLTKINQIVFIENKTNYDEYLLSELEHGTLAIYHGGFLSPHKKKLFCKIADAITPNIKVFFWADIDLGGFRMFAQLNYIIPCLMPMRMAAADIVYYQKTGLNRPNDYMERLKTSLEQNEFPMFTESIKQILECGVTIEQEAFLS